MVPSLLPVLPILCLNDATVEGLFNCITTSSSPTSIPNSIVEVQHKHISPGVFFSLSSDISLKFLLTEE